jgi:mycothiol system anti-sigma-R factor
MSLTCREFIEFLYAYLDGELPPEQARTFKAHLELCPPCVRYLESYQCVRELPQKCAELDREGPPPDMPEALVRAILDARRKT